MKQEGDIFIHPVFNYQHCDCTAYLNKQHGCHTVKQYGGTLDRGQQKAAGLCLGARDCCQALVAVNMPPIERAPGQIIK